MNKYPPLEYHDYLGLDRILDSQKLRSAELGTPVHDEMLFVIVHQAYELWFKQILTEFDSILAVFSAQKVDDRDMGLVVSRLQRIIEIQSLLLQQIKVLETMTPLDFLEFRDYLYPASGFQSVQNRLIENKLGLRSAQRLRFNQVPYERHLTEKHRDRVVRSQTEPSLFDLVEKWLERTPFLNVGTFSFWKEYRKAVVQMFDQDRAYIENNPQLSNEDKKRNLDEMTASLQTFEAIFDKSQYEELRKKGLWRLSFEALHAALFINIYRDQPALQLPFRLLQALQEIDENFTTWRYRHALMAHRMLGRKIGTGGSSGHKYLEQATEKHKVFTDLFNLTTYFIPRSKRPELPSELQKKLNYVYSQ